MRKEFYLNLITFCAVCSQGIAVISKENIDDRSDKSPTDRHIRKKRIINKSPGGTQPAHITMSRHIVQIVTHNDFECAGSILQTNIIIIPRNCFHGGLDKYFVLSGSLIRNNGTSHRIVKIVNHPTSNLALLLISPSITLSPSGSDKIALFHGQLPPNSYAHFSGWGCIDVSPTGQHIYPPHLMATLLPILTHQECYRAIIKSYLRMPREDILCTLDPRKEKSACHGDEGGSLVYGGRLLGIYSYNGGANLGRHPEIYVNLSNQNITEWINTNTHHLQLIGAQHFEI